MNEQAANREENIEIDLKQLLEAVMKKAWLIILIAILCAAIAFAVTYFLITPEYESSAMFYVNNSAFSVGETSLSITSSDITASKSLVETYIVILNTRSTLTDVIDYAGVDLTYTQLKDMITAGSVNETEVFQITVTHTDPYEAQKIADAIAYILPKKISGIIDGTSAHIVDAAVVPSQPSSPNIAQNTIIGFLIGAMLTVGVIVLRKLFDITIRNEADVTQMATHPILASVPDMSAASKGGYYRSYDKKSQKSSVRQKTPTTMVGDDISFAAAESYKLLRTKLQYSFAEEEACRVIGVSSALAGEGKSLTSVNLAFSLSQLGKRVLLIDCDMRRPSVSVKLPIAKSPGLSGYLSGQQPIDVLFQHCGIAGHENAFHVLASGKIPPNPMELLSSVRMERLIEHLRSVYDYIILDLPPVDEVGDALAVAKKIDGILMVVRQDYCNRVALNMALRQFAFLDARILGIVYNAATENGSVYGKKYYKKYYKAYSK